MSWTDNTESGETYGTARLNDRGRLTIPKGFGTISTSTMAPSSRSCVTKGTSASYDDCRNSKR